MKRALLVLPVAIVVVLFVLLLRARTDSSILTVDENTISTPAALPNDARASRDDPNDDVLEEPPIPVEVVLEQPPAPSDARVATVARLADGDSFDIVWADSGERDEVRLFGINAPEGDACFGNGARDVLDVLTDGQELQIQTIERDEFGRVLANVWVTDDLFVNSTLVELGAALALSDGGQHAGLITDAQLRAQTTAAGLWTACGADPNLQLRIETIESDAPGRDNENKNGEWIVVVNDALTGADLTDWSIRDESTRHRYFFPDGYVLGAGATVTVYSGCGTDGGDELYWCDDDPVWNNAGDTGFLVDPDGKFADSLSYGG